MFGIEAKEAPASLFARSPPRLPAGRSATLGRGVGGGSDLTPAMGVPAKGSTLPRSKRHTDNPDLLTQRPPRPQTLPNPPSVPPSSHPRPRAWKTAISCWAETSGSHAFSTGLTTLRWWTTLRTLGIVEIHPPQGHLHMNGHLPPHHASNGHLANAARTTPTSAATTPARTTSGARSRAGSRPGSTTTSRRRSRTSSPAATSPTTAPRRPSTARPRPAPAPRTTRRTAAAASRSRAPSSRARARQRPRPQAQHELPEGHPQSAQKTNLQETMETSLSAGGAAPQPNGLPPHYPAAPASTRAAAAGRAAAVAALVPRRGPHPLPSPHLGRQHPHELLGRGLASRRSGSYHHLAQLRQDAPSWRPHHYSVDNLADAQVLPSDHTYSGPAVTGGAQPAGGEGGGSGGSDSGRGTAGSGGEGRAAHALDTSLDSAASQRQAGQGHSSGNDSEWVDMTDAELQRIMKKGAEGSSKAHGGGLVRRESLAATPPLPPLSPEGSPQPSPQNSPARHRKYNLSYSVGGLNKPDLLEAAGRDGGGRAGGEGRAGNSSQGSSQSTPRRGGPTQTQHSHAGNAAPSGGGGSSNHRATGGPSGAVVPKEGGGTAPHRQPRAAHQEQEQD
ncbi:hypothetical protein C7M84_001906 [Penaeus vannamei]|uniref:Uncharacterized protein n=1 Tax=Penaeus vannamei TaxID=6689 RepID=A0A3R7QV65_PENVA|nr:hypothetical protein C7M84_001906 [Penaeus vannamei]